jgi:hypothetical protein
MKALLLIWWKQLWCFHISYRITPQGYECNSGCGDILPFTDLQKRSWNLEGDRRKQAGGIRAQTGTGIKN